jgi:hypothetical protein
VFRPTGIFVLIFFSFSREHGLAQVIAWVFYSLPVMFCFKNWANLLHRSGKSDCVIASAWAKLLEWSVKSDGVIVCDSLRKSIFSRVVNRGCITVLVLLYLNNYWGKVTELVL